MPQPTLLHRSLSLGVWLVWMGVIFNFSTQGWSSAETRSDLEGLWQAVSSLPTGGLTVDLEQVNHLLRKLAHFTEYAILAGLGYWGWLKGVRLKPQWALRATLLTAILFAISDEFHQRFVAGRTSAVMDVLIDSVGASVVVLICGVLLLVRDGSAAPEDH